MLPVSLTESEDRRFGNKPVAVAVEASMRRVIFALLTTSVTVFAADPALTVYNQDFAVIRENVTLDLKAGVNPVEFTGVTAQLEPESVLLRDPSNKQGVLILEQSYRADPIAMESLLALNEGATLDFLVRSGDKSEIVRGRIVRAGVSRPNAFFSHAAYPQQQSPVSAPLIEVDGKLRFDLPGIPLFPNIGGGAQLKPALNWLLQSDRAQTLRAELSYVSRGFNWSADYNMVQDAGSKLSVTAWVTVANHSGKAFENTNLKLMAGDVNKLRLHPGVLGGVAGGIVGGIPGAGIASPPQVAQKTFDEYHLYTVARPVTLHDKESKQIEMIRASNVASELIYVYDGARIDWDRYRHAPAEMRRQEASFGSDSHSKVWVMREFANTENNGLGIPLPKGRVRFYRSDTDGRLEFTGEDSIDHTPKGETVRIFTGAAFDIVGERKRTRFQIDHGRSQADEAFEITVRNRKNEPAHVRVVEHLYRWTTWEIPVTSQPFNKRDAQTVEFTLQLAPGESKTLTYSAHYQW